MRQITTIIGLACSAVVFSSCTPHTEEYLFIAAPTAYNAFVFSIPKAPHKGPVDATVTVCGEISNPTRLITRGTGSNELIMQLQKGFLDTTFTFTDAGKEPTSFYFLSENSVDLTQEYQPHADSISPGIKILANDSTEAIGTLRIEVTRSAKPTIGY